MLFSSVIFIYMFLPILLLVYYMSKPEFRNYILLISSLFFYAWGEPKVVFLMILVSFITYIVGKLFDGEKGKRDKALLVIGVVANLSFLIYFKYFMFLTDMFNNTFNTAIEVKQIMLPIGISFYTFQAISYIVDVYRDPSLKQNKFTNLLLFISFFPQLIAGPIVRYATINDEINERNETFSDFEEGFTRFILGVSKKMILANAMGEIADNAFGMVLNIGNISVSQAWLGAIAYTLQIYLDFSAYSDMAIGLAKMFGFHFLENFNYPYESKSITEFWRRWHISLGNWFRDYVYIPLGGNRRSAPRVIFNIFVVWLLTGIWHGSNYNFILWGLYYFVLLIIEKQFLMKFLNKTPSVFNHIYVMLLTTLGWVLFRVENMTQLKNYYASMFHLNNNAITSLEVDKIIYENGIEIIIAIIACTTIPKLIYSKFEIENYTAVRYITLFILLFISTSYMIVSEYNPFIYFNF